jgi:hypothetical protein
MSAYIREHDHRENVVKKCQRIAGLRDLIKTHEDSDNPDWIYIFRLQERLKKAEKQLEHMRP